MVWPVYAAIRGLKPHTRATVAVMFFILNLIALGLGPAVGIFGDIFAASLRHRSDAAFQAACCLMWGLPLADRGLKLSLLVTAG